MLDIKKVNNFPVVGFAVLFFGAFLFLQQKITIYIAAYKLSHNYGVYTELMGQRDYLARNYSREVSLSKINEWASKNSYVPITSERLLAMNNRPKEVFVAKQDNSKPSNVLAFVGKVFRINSAIANTQGS